MLYFVILLYIMYYLLYYYFTEELLNTDYGNNIDAAFSVSSVCVEEIQKLTTNPISRKCTYHLIYYSWVNLINSV